jgi:hypothetical protein
VYIDTGSPVPNIPSKSRGLAEENKKFPDLNTEKIGSETILNRLI